MKIRNTLSKIGLVFLLFWSTALTPTAESIPQSDSLALAFYDMPDRKCWSRKEVERGYPYGMEIVEFAFRIPCPENLTPYFIATLQRALAVRGLYKGPITGHIDTETRAAVLKFQQKYGFDSHILSLESSMKLGLVPIRTE